MSIVSRLLGFLPKLWGNWISLLGTTLATVAGNAFLILLVVDWVTHGANPYAGAFGYLLMPPLFVLGLILIAFGLWRAARRRARGVEEPVGRALEAIWKDVRARRRLLFFVVATVVNFTLISVAAFQAITYMDSPRFCGRLCHSVMKAEYNAYQLSPHARVPCVDCHIGEGASWFVRSKLSGLRQVWHAARGNFSRPIPTPIHNLRPARETCQHCHWPEKFHGERLLVRHSYADDESNTRRTNVVRLKIGGENRSSRRFVGIHWHVGPDVRIEYDALDGKRATIGQVTLTQGGRSEVYRAGKSGEGRRGAPMGERRVMDCVDCHNRPTHIYDPSPEAALDQAMAWGRVDPKLPFVHREGVKLLKQSLPDPRRAGETFTAALKSFYQGRAGGAVAAVEAAGRELGAIYERNIYPDLRIGWGTYPSHLGHRRTTEGCFRCHDDEHKSSSGKTIRQDCDLCHEVLAQDEEKPDLPETLLQLGSW
jgi:hypothetical protein